MHIFYLFADDIDVIDYYPIIGTEDDPVAMEADQPFDTHRGKILLQYQPAPKCPVDTQTNTMAKWRLWVEDEGKNSRTPRNSKEPGLC